MHNLPRPPAPKVPPHVRPAPPRRRHRVRVHQPVRIPRRDPTRSPVPPQPVVQTAILRPVTRPAAPAVRPTPLLTLSHHHGSRLRRLRAAIRKVRSPDQRQVMPPCRAPPPHPTWYLASRWPARHPLPPPAKRLSLKFTLVVVLSAQRPIGG